MQKVFFILLCLVSGALFAQGKSTDSYFDLNYFKGNIALHNNDILGLINGRPEGIILSWNKKTFGKEAWEQRYNYPDYGASLIYQNLKNNVLGNNLGVYAHYNFYFFKRNLMLRIGQGLAHTSNPYDRLKNPKNIAFGTRLLSSTYLLSVSISSIVIIRLPFVASQTLLRAANAHVHWPFRPKSDQVVTCSYGNWTPVEKKQRTIKFGNFPEDTRSVYMIEQIRKKV